MIEWLIQVKLRTDQNHYFDGLKLTEGEKDMCLLSRSSLPSLITYAYNQSRRMEIEGEKCIKTNHYIYVIINLLLCVEKEDE